MTDPPLSPLGQGRPGGQVQQGQLAPALILAPQRRDYRRPRRSIGPSEPYDGQDGISRSQQALIDGCRTLRAALNAPPLEGQSAPRIGLAQLTLHEARVAKSYRPLETFTAETCPVIGETDGLGKLLVVVTAAGLKQLEQRVTAPATADAANHLSSVATFTALDARYRLTLPMEQAIRSQLQRDGTVRVKVRLPRFELFTPLYQQELEQLEATFLGMEGIHQTPYLTLGNFLLYGADVSEIAQVTRFAALPYIDRVEVMPRYQPARLVSVSSAADSGSPSVQLGPIPDDLPTVVVADTGVAAERLLGPLMRASASFVQGPSDPAHGTAVAALVAAQRDTIASGVLTPRVMLIDARIFAGADEQVFEEDLIPRVVAAVRQFGLTQKVWNMSIASVPGPRPRRYSELGQRMDELRREFGLMGVFAAGNRSATNLRTAFPPMTDDDDWIYAPGDAIRNLTVTSLAPADAPPDAYARAHEPSPFAGRGLSPSGALLPLVAEYGGNVTQSGELIGIPTVDINGRICHMAGSSMTAALISGSLAELGQCFERSLAQENLVTDKDPLLLAKSALLHHADTPAILLGGANPAEFFGFGVPPTLEELIGDPVSRGTLLLATALAPDGEDLLLDHFPFPEGLRMGKHFRGEILLTLVTEPLLGSGESLEYVRSDVDVQFGPAEDDAEGEVHIRPNLLRLDTCDPAARAESELIKREQKWSPFRRYHVRLSPPGIPAARWALRARLRLRAEESAQLRAAREDHRHPERFGDLVDLYRLQVVIAISILDPQRQVPVRDQLLQQVRLRGDVSIPITVAPRIRSRFVAQ